MSRSLHPGAEQDLAEAARFYRQEGGSKLAMRFLDEFVRIVEVLERFPALGAPTADERRACSLQGFPYSVIYRHVGGGIRILVVRHHSRDPSHGAHRL
ncbi:MAG: type II toxin-antitoxin system RelE/ParE family toxin [Betaproteobacteria bacterium]|nr:type II toxin-antitoxin system RelE/ParE family toxin [Betaproteobacteria bacterium]